MPSILKVFVLITLPLGLTWVTPPSSDADEPPYGPSGSLGPGGAATRTCDGGAKCYVCTTESCSPSGQWQSRIEDASPGDTILLRAGTYAPGGNLDIPSGASSNPITIANFDNEAVTIAGGVVFESSHVRLEGLTIINESGSYALEIDSQTSEPRRNIELRHLDVIGGTSEAIRVRGNIQDLVLANSLLDGGRDHQVMKVLCDDNLSTPSADSCSFLPENVVITNNFFSKVRSPFFPRPSEVDFRGSSPD